MANLDYRASTEVQGLKSTNSTWELIRSFTSLRLEQSTLGIILTGRPEPFLAPGKICTGLSCFGKASWMRREFCFVLVYATASDVLFSAHSLHLCTYVSTLPSPWLRYPFSRNGKQQWPFSRGIVMSLHSCRGSPSLGMGSVNEWLIG